MLHKKTKSSDGVGGLESRNIDDPILAYEYNPRFSYSYGVSVL